MAGHQIHFYFRLCNDANDGVRRGGQAMSLAPACRLLCSLAAFFAAVSLPAADADSLRGGRFGWARLVTPDRNWNLHAEEDPVLASFIRTQTALNIDRTTYAADPSNLAQLCTYPLVFTNNIYHVTDAAAQRNLAEYVHRGGFIWVDFCHNLGGAGLTPGKFDLFFDETTAWFAKVFPRAQLRELPSSHEIYRSYFKIDLPVLGSRTDRWPWVSRHGMYGVFEDGKMVALVGLCAVMCIWNTDPAPIIKERKRLGANILVYAMTQTAALDAKP